MFNWLDRIFGINKPVEPEQPHFKRIKPQNNPWCLGAYSGYVPTTKLDYTVMLSHLRDIPEQTRIPHKHFKEATHDLIIVYAAYIRNKKVYKTLHHQQYNFGWWKIQYFQDPKERWRNPALYDKSIKEIDACANLVLAKVVNELETQQYAKYLLVSSVSRHHWNIVVMDACDSCPNLVPPLVKKLDNIELKTDGVNVWIDDSINLKVSD